MATSSVDKKLITVSIIEILIILAAGIYQFVSLKNYLVSKQYI
jgi:predicted metal-binding membrane protein